MVLEDDKGVLWTYERLDKNIRDDSGNIAREKGEYRWCLNFNDQKRWYKKNKISGEWEYYDVIGLYLHVDLWSNRYVYCVYCGMKQARFCFREYTRKCRELGIWQEDKESCYKYDLVRMKELELMEDGDDIPKWSCADGEIPYLWECLNGCKIKNVEKDLYQYKKEMIKERMVRGMETEHLNQYRTHKEKKDKLQAQIEKNEKLWEKFMK